MTETEQLIKQAARELQIEPITLETTETGTAASFSRKDGSKGGIFFRTGTSLTEIIDRLRDESKSAVKAERSKAEQIAELEAKLKDLKGE